MVQSRPCPRPDCHFTIISSVLVIFFAHHSKSSFSNLLCRRRILLSSRRCRRASPESTTELALTAHAHASTAVLSLTFSHRDISNKVTDTINHTVCNKLERCGTIESPVERLFRSISLGAWLRRHISHSLAQGKGKNPPEPLYPKPSINTLASAGRSLRPIFTFAQIFKPE